MQKSLIDLHGPEKVIQTLDPFFTENRKNRIQQTIDSRINHIHVAIESPADIYNAFAVVRTCEALGIANVHFIDAKNRGGNGKRTMLGTQRWVHLKRHPSFSGFSQEAHSYTLIGSSPRGSHTLEDIPLNKPLCLLLGNEKRGLSDEALSSCEYVYKIPMFGMVESYNLSVSAAISLYQLADRYRAKIPSLGDLSSMQKKHELAEYYLRCYGKAKAELLF